MALVKTVIVNSVGQDIAPAIASLYYRAMIQTFKDLCPSIAPITITSIDMYKMMRSPLNIKCERCHNDCSQDNIICRVHWRLASDATSKGSIPLAFHPDCYRLRLSKV